MAGKKIPVETVLSARDVNTNATWEKLAQAAQHYHGAMSQAQSAFNGFQTLVAGGTVLAAGAGLVGTATKITEIGSAAEKTQQSLAGSFQVYGFAKSYADAIYLADDAVMKFKKDAAALPGTTEDFIRSFDTNSMKQYESGVNSINEAMDRSNKLTAVLLAKGVDSGQIGRDLSQMFGGHAGADVNSFVKLQGQLGVKDAAHFNKKSAQERIKLLDQVIGKNKDVIAAFSSTWEAASSTTESFFKDMVKAGTAPLFEAAKNNLKAMNDYLEPLMPQIEKTLRLGGGAAVAGGSFLMRGAGNVIQAAMPSQHAMGVSAAAAGQVLNYLATAGNSFLHVLTPIAGAFSSFGSLMAELSSAIGPGLMSLGETIFSLGTLLAGGIGDALSNFWGLIGPLMSSGAALVGKGMNVLADTLIIGAYQLKKAFDLVANSPAFQKLISIDKKIVGWMVDKLDWTGAGNKVTQAVHNQAEEARKAMGIGRVDASGGLGDYVKKRQLEQELDDEAKRWRVLAAQNQAAKNKRPTINQDFRGSKFSIEQKFAQGFDPGRVLTAVREDTQKMAQRRLSSGLTPLFGKT